jgi:transposase
MVVMALCLMVYAIAQAKIRKKLQESNDTVPTQNKKETNNPTFKWIMKMFRGVSIAQQTIGDEMYELVANITATRRKIIEHFGARTMAIYGVKPRILSG